VSFSNYKRFKLACRNPPYLLVLLGWQRHGMSNLSLVHYVQMCKHFQVISPSSAFQLQLNCSACDFCAGLQQGAVSRMQHVKCGSDCLQDTFSAPQLLLLLSGPIPSRLMLLLNLCFQTHKNRMTPWVLKKSLHLTQRLVCTCSLCTIA